MSLVRKSLALRLYWEILRSKGICLEQQWQQESPSGGRTLLVVVAEDSSEADEADEAGDEDWAVMGRWSAGDS